MMEYANYVLFFKHNLLYSILELSSTLPPKVLDRELECLLFSVLYG